MSKRRVEQSTASPVIPEIAFHDLRKVHPALRNYLAYCFHKMACILKSEAKSAFEKHHLQGHHFAILSVIASTKVEINQMKLCEETGIDKASMVKIIDQLEKVEYIERVGSKQDRRVKNIALTRPGSDFVRGAQKQVKNIEANLLGALTSKEASLFRKLLLKILDHQQST